MFRIRSHMVYRHCSTSSFMFIGIGFCSPRVHMVISGQNSSHHVCHTGHMSLLTNEKEHWNSVVVIGGIKPVQPEILRNSL